MDNEGRRNEDLATAARRSRRMLRRDLLITLAVAVVAFLLAGRGGRGMTLELGAESIAASPPGSTAITVRYEDIAGVQLCGEIDFGTCVEGGQTDACWHGTWENGGWGRYVLCVHPKVAAFAVIELRDGGRVVVNGGSERETGELVEALHKLKSGGSDDE